MAGHTVKLVRVVNGAEDPMFEYRMPDGFGIEVIVSEDGEETKVVLSDENDDREETEEMGTGETAVEKTVKERSDAPAGLASVKLTDQRKKSKPRKRTAAKKSTAKKSTAKKSTASKK